MYHIISERYSQNTYCHVLLHTYLHVKCQHYKQYNYQIIIHYQMSSYPEILNLHHVTQHTNLTFV